ncbi:histone deacetylase 8-like [Acanthaster planci]|uniref:Histone deacetylase 8 n=1 Tax=Acanthaster planci TaxID=133434 RepID=A0A8B7Z4A4_ACAPL|nr:histone deacetylase 8-like [Acanthaster planci]
MSSSNKVTGERSPGSSPASPTTCHLHQPQEDQLTNVKSPPPAVPSEPLRGGAGADADGGPSTSTSMSDRLLQRLELLAENVPPARDAPLSPARASLSVEKSLHMYYSMKRTETFSTLYDFDCSSSTTSSSSEKLLQRLEELSENIPPGFLASPDRSPLIGKSLPLLKRTDDSCATYDFDGSSSASSTTSENVSKRLEQLSEYVRPRLSPGRSVCPGMAAGGSRVRKRSAPTPLKPLNRLAPPKLKRRGVGGSRWETSSGDKINQVSTSSGVVYVYSEPLIKLCDTLLKVPKRAGMVHSLLEAYGLLQNMTVLPPHLTTKEDLTVFHSQDFVDCLERLNQEDDSEKNEELKLQFGLGYDCPTIPHVFDFVCLAAGATLRAAQALVHGESRVAINWCGGWHHAKRDEASGFCYVNDVVLGILKLREKFDRVLYLDLDLHHGDGVEDAFCYTPKVLTCSFHKYCPGFFPGTGSLDDVGIGKGKFYSVNVPLKDGIQDNQYFSIFCRVVDQIKQCYRPSAVVVQCGADTLADDPMQSFNLTPAGLARCLHHVTTAWQLPALLLGGGGYRLANTARCWANLTSTVLGCRLPAEIPEHEHFLEYGPDYQLDISPTHRPNLNSDEYIEKIIASITDNLEKISDG